MIWDLKSREHERISIHNHGNDTKTDQGREDDDFQDHDNVVDDDD